MELPWSPLTRAGTCLTTSFSSTPASKVMYHVRLSFDSPTMRIRCFLPFSIMPAGRRSTAYPMGSAYLSRMTVLNKREDPSIPATFHGSISEERGLAKVRQYFPFTNNLNRWLSVLASMPNIHTRLTAESFTPPGMVSVSHSMYCTESIDLRRREEVTSGCGE